MKLKCILIDDETDAIDALRVMITDFYGDKAEVIGIASSVNTAIALISRMHPDIVFLDIEMPGGSGFKVAEAFPDRKFKLVFVTAYDQYAIRALKLKAEDYLLKPVDHDELEKLINDLSTSSTSSQTPTKVKIPAKNSLLFVDPSDIIYIKGDGRYSEIFLKNSKSYVVTRNIGLYESDLANSNFLRVHKSYLVNLKQVTGLLSEDSIILSNGHRAEISRRKKQELKSRLDALSGF